MSRLHKRLSLFCYNTFEIWDLNSWDDGREMYYKTIYPNTTSRSANVSKPLRRGVKHFKNVGLITYSYGQPEYIKIGIIIEWLHIKFI